MQDVIYVGTTIMFFLLCAGYVRRLDRLVRAAGQAENAADLMNVELSTGSDADNEVDAGAEVPAGDHRGDRRVTSR